MKCNIFEIKNVINIFSLTWLHALFFDETTYLGLFVIKFG